MKTFTLLSSILVISLLQGCTGLGPMYSQTGNTLPTQSLNTSAENASSTLLMKQPIAVFEQNADGSNSQRLNETRIIKELSNAGCTISSFEMNKNKQNIRIICADSIQQSDFAI